ncbi:MAG: TonB-dependent receptor [Candidatus Scalindua sp.]|nr:TonB-dependent receptor [Candidatus Scalindua sp.]
MSWLPYQVDLERRNFDFSGANLLTRWKHVYSEDSDMILQIYYDHTYRKAEIFRDKRDTFDLDFQHRFRLGSRQDIVWGLGYRFTSDGFVGFKGLQLNPSNRGLNLYSAFFQDEVTIINDLLRLTLGSKFVCNEYTGLEIQPTAKILLTPSKRHTLWGAVSRAVKIPGRLDRDIDHTVTTFPLGPFNTGILKVLGSTDSVSEEMISYELGYRIQPMDHFSIDVAGFYNVYDNLQSNEVRDPFSISPTETVFPIVDDNEIHGKTYGFEIAANWNVTDYWKLKTGYTFLRIDLSHDGARTAFENEDDVREGLSPNNQAHILSYLDMPYNLELDTSLYYVDHLATDNISSYLRLDMRLGWKPTKSLDMCIGMKNMLDGEHLEFSGTTSDRIQSTEVERSVYGKITWEF